MNLEKDFLKFYWLGVDLYLSDLYIFKIFKFPTKSEKFMYCNLKALGDGIWPEPEPAPCPRR